MVFMCVFILRSWAGFYALAGKAPEVSFGQQGPPLSALAPAYREPVEPAELAPTPCPLSGLAAEVRTYLFSHDGLTHSNNSQSLPACQRSATEKGENICWETQNSEYCINEFM